MSKLPNSTAGKILRRIQRFRSSSNTYPSRPLRLVFNWIITIAVGLSFVFSFQTEVTATVTQDDEDPVKRVESIVVTAVDPQGQPVKGVKIHAGVWSGSGYKADTIFPPNQFYFTDKEGKATVLLPHNYYIVRLWISSDDYVPMFTNWEEAQIMSGDGPPKELKLKMISGIEIGGKIVDEDGKPVPNALVSVRGTATHKASSRIRLNGSWSSKSDKNGNWVVNNAMPGDDASFTVQASHSDFIIENKPTRMALIEAREKRATLALTKGIRIKGTVVGPNDIDIDRGLVVWGDSPYFERGSQEEYINGEGQFALPPLPPGKLRLTFIVPGHSPLTQIVNVSETISPLRIKLEDGRQVKIKIVDQAGEPIGNAYAQVDTWRGVNSIYSHDHPNVKPTGIPVQADSDGVFIWEWAPSDAVMYNFSARGYISKRGIAIAPAAEPHVIKLTKRMNVSGSIVDKESGTPIKHVAVVPMIYQRPETDPHRADERRSQSVIGSAKGEFAIELDRENCSYRLLFEAKGYQPFKSELFKVGDSLEPMQIELIKGKTIVHRIVDEHGEPAKDARVFISTQSIQLDIHKFATQRNSKEFRTDSNGNISMMELQEPHIIVAYTNSGYAQTPFKPGDEVSTIKLKPFASLNGIFTVKDKPIADATVMYHPAAYIPDLARLNKSFMTKTDSRGQFQFGRLPNGNGKLSLLSKRSKESRYDRYETTISVGMETKFTDPPRLAVNGQFLFQLDEPLTGKIDYEASHITLRRTELSFELPPEIVKMNLDLSNLEVVNTKLIKERKLGAYMTISCSYDSYSTSPNSEGVFDHQVFKPGEYELELSVIVIVDGKKNYKKAVLPPEFRKVTIGEKPLSLGEIVITGFELNN